MNAVIEDGIERHTISLIPNYDGIGLHLASDGIISYIEPNSPAKLAGLLKDQVIVEVNGQNVRGLKNKEIATLIKANTDNLIIGVEDKSSKNNKIAKEPPRVSEAIENTIFTPSKSQTKNQEFYENIEIVKTNKPLDETIISQEPESVVSKSEKQTAGMF
jgi:predicted metalloprotease with PDZ domain